MSTRVMVSTFWSGDRSIRVVEEGLAVLQPGVAGFGAVLVRAVQGEGLTEAPAPWLMLLTPVALKWALSPGFRGACQARGQKASPSLLNYPLSSLICGLQEVSV